jgi:hypothetical protein
MTAVCRPNVEESSKMMDNEMAFRGRPGVTFSTVV